MTSTGIIRKFDDLGRIVIPREIREKVLGTSKVEGLPMEIFIDKNNSIILKKCEDVENSK